MIYRGTTNRQYSLVRELAHGGEGTVFSIEGEPYRLAKIYHSSALSDHKQQEKILNMVRESKGEACQYIAWPLDALFDDTYQVCGFVMKKFGGVQSLAELLPEKNLSWAQRVLVAHNLCDVVREVHEMNQCIGDMNPSNFGVDLSQGHVYAFDADSFHYHTQANHFFPCYVGLPEYYAPELQRKITRGQDMRTLDPADTFNRQTDLFALAVLIFQLMFSGYHPFSGRRLEVCGSSTVVHKQSTNILNKVSPYFNPQPGTGTPVGAPPLSIIPPDVQGMFRQAFLTENRPSATDWQRKLFDLLRNVSECPKHHSYYKGLTSCPWCELERSTHTPPRPKPQPTPEPKPQPKPQPNPQPKPQPKPQQPPQSRPASRPQPKPAPNPQPKPQPAPTRSAPAAAKTAASSPSQTPARTTTPKKSINWKRLLFVAAAIILMIAIFSSGSKKTSTSSTSSSYSSTAKKQTSSSVGNYTGNKTTSAPTATPKPMKVKNGQMLITPDYQRVCPFKVEVPAGNDYYIYLQYIGEPDTSTKKRNRLSSAKSPYENDVAIYVQGSKTANVKVPIGNYKLYYATGETFFGTDSLFGSSTSYYTSSETLSFSAEKNGYAGHTLTLKPSVGGNFGTRPMGESSFPKH